MATIADAVVDSGRTIGRYFGIVSTIPSALLVAYVYLLTQSDVPSGAPQWGKGFSALSSVSLGSAVVLAMASLGLSLALHPFQFSVTQFFEGYWGQSRPAQRLRVWRMTHYRRRLEALHEEFGRTAEIVQEVRDEEAQAVTAMFTEQTEQNRPAQVDLVDVISKRDEVGRLVQAYPGDADDIMPTRLGNVLRKYERSAGRVYELDAVSIVPPLMLISTPEHVRHVTDQRIQLDLAIRLCLVSLLAAVASVLFLWDNGLWLLVALAPYGLAYLFYRGSVVVAAEFGFAFSVLVELNRFALYDRLRMPAPKNLEDERKQNRGLIQILDGDVPESEWTYDHPAPPGSKKVGLYRWKG